VSERSVVDGGRERTEATPKALYTLMMRISALEDGILKALSAGTFRAPFYPVRGLEPACAAVGLALKPTDYIVSTYRCLGDVLAKGVPMREIMAELFGRAAGTSKGKGGSMHMAAPDYGLMATTGVVGAGMPIAAGLGLAALWDGADRVVVTTFGDGASSTGAFHESLNLASLWSLPVVFLCQNNQWGEHTSIDDYTRQPVIATRAEAVTMKTIRVDGFDSMAVFSAVREAVDHARMQRAPVFLESVTFRLRPHAYGTDEPYIPKSKREAAIEKDPVPNMRRLLINSGALTVDEVSSIDEAILVEVDDAIRFAESAPPTPIGEMMTDVYASTGGMPL
jgi:TPP-dependent pyruvate/acetoin dehydrogenase alpha subunit